jgi:hypothetical protein
MFGSFEWRTFHIYQTHAEYPLFVCIYVCISDGLDVTFSLSADADVVFWTSADADIYPDIHADANILFPRCWKIN